MIHEATEKKKRREGQRVDEEPGGEKEEEGKENLRLEAWQP